MRITVSFSLRKKANDDYLQCSLHWLEGMDERLMSIREKGECTTGQSSQYYLFPLLQIQDFVVRAFSLNQYFSFQVACFRRGAGWRTSFFLSALPHTELANLLPPLLVISGGKTHVSVPPLRLPI